MIRPDYRDFRTRSKSFRHSSEGSSWKKHKYIKTIPSDKTKAIGVAEEAAKRAVAEEAAKKAVALVDADRNKKTK